MIALAADQGRRKLAAILAADVVGYSRLMADDERATVAALKDARRSFRDRIEQRLGRLIDTAGDSVLATFESVVEAVHCAIDVQHDLEGMNEPLPEDRRMRFRIGVNLGDVIEEGDGTIYGDGVNVAARLEGLAPPSGICISAAVSEQIDGKVTETFEDLGDHNVKNITRPIRALVWSQVAVEPQIEESQGRKSTIAIGELIGIGNASEELARGVANGIATALTNQTGVRFVAEGGNSDFLLTGQLQIRDNRYRATLRLIDRRTQEAFASERFKGDVSDPFQAEDELIYRFYGATRFAIYAREAEAASSGAQTNDIESAISRAGQLLLKPSLDASRESRSIVETVLRTQPDNFMALSMMASANCGEALVGYRKIAEEDRRTAMSSAREAVNLNPNSDYAHFVLSQVQLFCERDYASAENEARRSIEINPYYPWGWVMLGVVFICTGRASEGIEHCQKASETNTRWIGSFWGLLWASLGEFVRGRYAESKELAMRSDQRQPDLPRALIILAGAAAHAGDERVAQDAADRLLKVVPDFRVCEFGNWPFRDAESGERLIQGLRQAGLPK